MFILYSTLSFFLYTIIFDHIDVNQLFCKYHSACLFEVLLFTCMHVFLYTAWSKH
jgi:hypothetical protein